ncbi:MULTISPECIES: hypothetical protein [Pseudomonadati]|uniref:Porin family protein n=1 Tax=Shewanella aestuarii TaxID=1028752 RepID=A0ABT0KYY5_9GAMM|nr:hypothetical protein [Shewanella aestuarii]MCL1116584.1 hypothetical protein [Shewanella aestuarii]
MQLNNQFLCLFISVISLNIEAFATEKNPEDPTKIVTKLGVGYNEQFTFSGSIGLDETRMINMSINDDGSDWRLGGSWLFDFGIVNFNVNRNEYDDGAHNNGYSIGTFIPLSYFGFTPGGWQIFPMAGYHYTNGEVVTTGSAPYHSDIILMPSTSHGAYIGAFGLKSLSDNWTLMAFGGGARGSSDYASHWYGTGISYKIGNNQSINTYGFISDSNYGENKKIGISYKYEFE